MSHTMSVTMSHLEGTYHTGYHSNRKISNFRQHLPSISAGQNLIDTICQNGTVWHMFSYNVQHRCFPHSFIHPNFIGSANWNRLNLLSALIYRPGTKYGVRKSSSQWQHLHWRVPESIRLCKYPRRTTRWVSAAPNVCWNLSYGTFIYITARFIMIVFYDDVNNFELFYAISINSPERLWWLSELRLMWIIGTKYNTNFGKRTVVENKT